MILYLSGKITGNLFYKFHFETAEAALVLGGGHIILNPAKLPKGLRDYEDYMKIGMAMLDAADGIVMLPGWKKSNGAKRELRAAMKAGKKIYFGTDQLMKVSIER